MRQLNLALLSVAVLGVGIYGFNDGMFSISAENSPQTYGETTGMLGHLTAIQYDNEGNPVKYTQTDNTVVNEGKQCLTLLTFGAHNQTSGCAVNEAMNRIALYDNTQDPDDTDDTFGATTFKSGNGLSPIEITLNNGGTANGGEDQYNGVTSDGKAFLQVTFTSSADSEQVEGAAITNNGTSDTMFAAQNFTSPFTLNTNDKLTVSWEITLS